MKWTPFIYGCFSNHGIGYTFDVLNLEHQHIVDAVLKSHRHYGGTSQFAGRINDSVFFGHRKDTGAVFGSTHPVVQGGGGRRMPFYFGYVAPAGTALPTESELSALQIKMDKDLKHLAGRCVEKRSCLRGIEPIDLPEFGLGIAGTSPWDDAVKKLSQGQHAGSITIGESGILENSVSARVASASITYSSILEKLKSGLSTTKGKTIAFSSGAVVLIGGAILANHFYQKHKQEAQSQAK